MEDCRRFNAVGGVGASSATSGITTAEATALVRQGQRLELKQSGSTYTLLSAIAVIVYSDFESLELFQVALEWTALLSKNKSAEQ